MSETKAKSKPEKKEFAKYKITKDIGKVILKGKEFVGDIKLKRFKKKGMESRGGLI